MARAFLPTTSRCFALYVRTVLSSTRSIPKMDCNIFFLRQLRAPKRILLHSAIGMLMEELRQTTVHC